MRSAADKLSLVGDTVVFECLSHRAPHSTTTQLRVDWLKDGQPIATSSQSPASQHSQTIATDAQSSLLKDSRLIAADLQRRGGESSRQSQSRRHYLIADSQILVLLSVQQSDAGVYTCIVSNSVGSERAVSTLRVIDEPLSSSLGDQDTDESLTVRVGLAVIAAVCGVVLTSLAWVIIIYCLQRRHDRADSTSSTSTDETVIPTAASTSPPTGPVNTLDSLQHCLQLCPGTLHDVNTWPCLANETV